MVPFACWVKFAPAGFGVGMGVAVDVAVGVAVAVGVGVRVGVGVSVEVGVEVAKNLVRGPAWQANMAAVSMQTARNKKAAALFFMCPSGIR